MNRVICRQFGHRFKPSRQYLLPARKCTRCGSEQVQLPNTGKWVNREVANDD